MFFTYYIVVNYSISDGVYIPLQCMCDYQYTLLTIAEGTYTGGVELEEIIN